MRVRSDEVLLGIEIVIVVAHGATNDLIDIALIAEEAANATESLHKLEAVGRLVRDELDRDTVVFVV